MHTKTPTNPDESIRKLGELIKDIKIAMLTTIDADGTLRSRPMACQEVEFNGDLWFFTRKSSGKIHAVTIEQQVNVAYSAPSDHRYISITGRAEVIEDHEKEAELWNPLFKAWFPEGLNDPDLVLLKVKVDFAEYWDSKSSTMVHLIGFTKAVLTGESYKPSKDEHDTVKIRH